MVYRVVETNQRVVDTGAELVTRFRWRAERRCKKLNEQRLADFYRYQVFWVEGKWEIWVMQNRAVPI